MSVINTNITSLIAQQNLNKSQNSLSTAMERLSSGMRINSAKDDAAGQAIANRFSSQINGLNQAVRNSNDGISIAQTTEGSLNQINDNLQTIRTLTVQAQNGTNSSSDLSSIQEEINQRLNEIDRISSETDFNGTKVLAEGAGALRVQVGANDDQVININLTQIDVSSLNLSGFNVDGVGTANTAATETQVQAQGFTLQADGSYLDDDFNTATSTNAATVAAAMAQVQNSEADDASVTDGTITYNYDAATDNFTYDEADRADATGSTLASELTPSGSDTTALTINGPSGTIDVKVDSAGNVTKSDGSTLYFDATNGNLTENAAGGEPLASIDDIAGFMTGAGGSMTIWDGTTSYATNSTAATYDVTGDTISADQLEARINTGTYAGAATADYDFAEGTGGDTYSFAGTTLQNGAAANLFISGFDDEKLVLTADQSVYENDAGQFTDERANVVYAQENGQLTLDAVSGATATDDPLATLDAALNQVDSLRSELGAVQNRFGDAIFNLETNALNLSDARSRIEDADYAKEVAEMTRAQILQQAGTSVLAQANQLPQNVLSLLG